MNLFLRTRLVRMLFQVLNSQRNGLCDFFHKLISSGPSMFLEAE